MRKPLSLGLGVVIAALWAWSAAACSAGVSSTGFDEGGAGDGASDARTGPDGTTVLDAGIVDGSGGDAGPSCSQLGGTYSKTCTTVADCTTFARGCYCGAQPIIGVAKSASAAAAACETKARNECALGCPNAPGRVAEDGKNDIDGGTINVLCETNQCRTVLQ